MNHNRSKNKEVYLGKPFTVVEQQIVNLLCKNGMANKEIASALNISEKTVKVHFLFIFDKLGCNSRTEVLCKLWQKKYDKLKQEYEEIRKAA